jgi:hypothetical protein
MSRFCRHGRFIERCPICRDTVPGLAPVKQGSAGAGRSASAATHGSAAARRRARGSGKDLRVYRDGAPRGDDDGYRSALAPGLRNCADAQRLAEELAFAAGRLTTLGTAPPGLYAEARQQASWERATWMCFLIAYLSPLQGDDPFRGIQAVLSACPEESEGVPVEGGGVPVEGEDVPREDEGAPRKDEGAPREGGDAPKEGEGVPDWRKGELPDLAGIPLGPRTSHDPARGADTLRAYLQWAERAGSQVGAFSGDPNWSEERRFERLFERLQLPGLGRMGRYDMLVTVGRLGLYELRADSLHFGGAGGGSAQATGDPATLAAKRLFGIGDPLVLERRALALADAASVPLDALDLAFANWGAGERATLGVPADRSDTAALERARGALEL